MPGTYVFLPPGVPHNIANASDKPARMIMTVSPPGHEHYFEELVKLVAHGSPPDAKAIAALRAPLRHRAAHRAEGHLGQVRTEKWAPLLPPESRQDGAIDRLASLNFAAGSSAAWQFSAHAGHRPLAYGRVT